VPTGEALIATRRRAPVASIAVVMERVPGAAIPASELLCDAGQVGLADADGDGGNQRGQQHDPGGCHERRTRTELSRVAFHAVWVSDRDATYLGIALMRSM
jgi:hypothetical protein